jgi:hypothetical protein
MRTLLFPRIRPAYAVAACSITLAVTCAWQTPGLMQAILVVGANAQLPLERLAAAEDAAAPESAKIARANAKPASRMGQCAHRCTPISAPSTPI